MKSQITTLLILLGLSIGCKTDTTPTLNPDLTAELIGIYPLVSFQEGSEIIALPTPTASARFETSAIDFTHLRAKLIVVNSGATQEYSNNIFTLTRDEIDASRYTITVANKPIGYMTATVIEVSDGMPNGAPTLLKAKR